MFKLYCILQLFTTLYNCKKRSIFYKWFHNRSNIRGLSTCGYKLFGIIPFPVLSYTSFNIVQLLYLLFLILNIFDFYCNYFIILFLWLLYCSSLWAEESMSYHREELPTVVYIYYVLQNKTENETIIYIRIFISSIYFISAIQKIILSIIQNRYWAKYTPLSLIWNAMWSKPKWLIFQKFLIRNPSFVTLLSTFVIISELILFPLTIMRIQLFITIVSINIIGMHIFITIILGIDYSTNWVPVLLCYFVIPCDMNYNYDVNFQYLFTILQIIFMITCAESFNINMPPFMSTPMFVLVKPMLSPDARSYAIRIKRKDYIEWERLEWNLIFAKNNTGIGLSVDELSDLTFDFILFGRYKPSENWMKGNPSGYIKILRDNIQLNLETNYGVSDSEIKNKLNQFDFYVMNEPYFIISNKLLSDNLSNCLIKMLKIIDSYNEDDQYDNYIIEQLLDQYSLIMHNINLIFTII